VPLTDENKPGSRRDRLYSMSPCYQKVTNGRLTVNWLGSPLESKNISMEGSQVPRSMKYLKQVRSACMRRELGVLLTGEC